MAAQNVYPLPITLPPIGQEDREPTPRAPEPAVTDFALAELTNELGSLGLPAYRTRQLFRGVHHRHVSSWDDLTDLPAAVRAQLAARFRLHALTLRAEQRSADGTVKLLLDTWDGQQIETVHIPAGEAARGRSSPQSADLSSVARGLVPRHPGWRERSRAHPGYGRGTGPRATSTGRAPTPSSAGDRLVSTRLTVCVSSQAGCALACRFCATGQMGFARNLTIGEIVEQIYRAESPGGPRRVDNIVFMGMGEPMANYANVVGAIRLLADPLGYGFSPRRITVSTSGLVPPMVRLAGEDLDVRLAVSLHAPDDALRSQLMPINRRYPIAEVIAAAATYAERSSRRVSYEYVMLDGVNDSSEQATQLAEILRHQRAHVNLIPYNQTHSGYRSSPPERIRAFAEHLRARGVPCTIRASRGSDIAAACGQLKAEIGDQTTSEITVPVATRANIADVTPPLP